MGTDIIIRSGPTDGMVVLGVPVGSPRFIGTHLESLCKKMEADIAAIEGLKLPLQQQYLLLTKCIASQMQFVQRAVKPSMFNDDFYTAASRLMCDFFYRMVFGDDTTAGDEIIEKMASLPAKRGGFGISFPLYVGIPAYLAGLGAFLNGGDYLPACVRELQRGLDSNDLFGALDILSMIQEDQPYKTAMELNKVTKLPGNHQEIAAACRKGKGLARLIQDVFVDYFANDVEERMDTMGDEEAPPHVQKQQVLTAKSNLWSHQQQGASELWTLLPSDHGLKLSDRAFRVAAALRLGYIFPPCVRDDSGPLYRGCSQSHGKELLFCDIHHCTSCIHITGPGNLTERHNNVLKELTYLMRRAGASAILEPQSIVTSTNTHADLYLAFPLGQAQLMIDVTVISPTPEGKLYATAKEPLAACRLKEEEKAKSYRDMYKERGINFRTMAFEVSGAYGNETKEIFKELAQFFTNYNQDTGFPETFMCRTYLKYVKQRLAVRIAESNANNLFACVTAAKKRIY